MHSDPSIAVDRSDDGIVNALARGSLAPAPLSDQEFPMQQWISPAPMIAAILDGSAAMTNLVTTTINRHSTSGRRARQPLPAARVQDLYRQGPRSQRRRIQLPPT